MIPSLCALIQRNFVQFTNVRARVDIGVAMQRMLESNCKYDNVSLYSL